MRSPPLVYVLLIFDKSTDEFINGLRDAGKGQLLLYGAQFKSGFWHAVDNGAGRILSDGGRTQLAHFEQAGSTVFADTGKDDAHGMIPCHIRHAVEEYIYRWADTVHWRSGLAFEHIAGAHAGDGHMLGSRRNVDVIGQYHIPADRFLYGKMTFRVQALGKEAGEHGRNVLDDDNARQRRLQLGEN